MATLPCEFRVVLSENFKPGQPLSVRGPHGLVKVQPPPDATPGTELRYRLAPMPDFNVKVPEGCQPGMMIRFARTDGVEISVPVPPGKKAGDSFTVTPPALMVQVPEGAKAGDLLIFHNRGKGGALAPGRFRARVPAGLEAGMYLTARLPRHERSEKDAEGLSWGLGWLQAASTTRGLGGQ